MTIICAPDSFKESLDAAGVARAMAAGIGQVDPTITVDTCPVADGGEGTMSALVGALGGTVHVATVPGPLMEDVEACFAIADAGRLGIVELASASGLARVPAGRRDPMRTTTYGTGVLIARAIAAGCTKILVGVGGSATCDGGVGLAQALGATFFDADGRVMEPPVTGRDLGRIARAEPAATLPPIVVACDVTNPLLGPEGAAVVYGPQKGGTPTQIVELEAGLTNLALRCGGDPTRAGAGAAGGAGYGLATFCAAALERGIDLVLDAVGFGARCADATLVLTGEGRLEANSLSGKACIGVARAAQAAGVPTIAITGSTGPGADRCLESAGGPLRAYESLSQRYGVDRAMAETSALITTTTVDVIRVWSRVE